jgi:acetylornithine/succinyldiaminopimelate/putrescine aminotransferase
MDGYHAYTQHVNPVLGNFLKLTGRDLRLVRAQGGVIGRLGGIKLKDVNHPWLRWENLGLEQLRGRPISGALVVERLARRNILVQVCAHDWSVIRVEPPLTVDPDACARFVAAMADAVRWLEENA